MRPDSSRNDYLVLYPLPGTIFGGPQEGLLFYVRQVKKGLFIMVLFLFIKGEIEDILFLETVIHGLSFPNQIFIKGGNHYQILCQQQQHSISLCYLFLAAGEKNPGYLIFTRVIFYFWSGFYQYFKCVIVEWDFKC